MNLSALIRDLPVTAHRMAAEAAVTGVVEDSRRAHGGCLFVVRQGSATDGRRYIPDAVEAGAVGVLTDAPPDQLGKIPENVAILGCGDAATMGVELAQRLHGWPAERLRLVGVTGTNGKTTTAYMVRHLLRAAGDRCGMIGTVEFDDGVERRPASLTTPGAIELIGLLGRMVANGCDRCVMEVSSHALEQGRVDPLSFDVAAFTNLSGDHLDYHGTMEAYAAAKARLFASLAPEGWAVVNADDEAAERMVAGCRGRVLRYGLELEEEAADDGERGDVLGRIREATPRYTDFVAGGPWGWQELRLPLIGRHNVANMLAAVGVAHALGKDVRELVEAVAGCPTVPGRLERVEPEAGPKPPFAVVVDYSHTDDALENVLRALRPVTPNRLRVMFGCGGDRDPSKRPRMAGVACRWADDVVVTSDNPRTEDPESIIEQIMAGVPETARDRVRVEADRGRAIRRIIADAESGDVVLLAGKGHEDYQIIGTEKRHFDDREQAREAIEALAGRKAG